MGITQIGTIGVLCAALVLSGCSAQAVRGKPAETRDECRQDWLKERQSHQTGTVRQSSTFAELLDGLFFNFVGFTTAPDVANARYRACLERLGVTNVDAFNAQNEALGLEGPYLPPLAPRRPAHCPEYASVLFGGAGYCVGR